MTRIESDAALINKTQERVFGFLNDMNNFGKLMPEQVIKWKSDKDRCTFTIKGMADISLKITERIPSSKILMTSDDETPLQFTLECEISEAAENQSYGRIIMYAELNAMTEMLAKSPLQNFVNILAEKLKDLEDRY
ncbi:MAG: hypothetical protein V1904_00175 [Bacteroidota bacterium]